MWRATQKAADAAATAAEALPIVERAYVYPMVIRHGPFNTLIRNANVFYLGEVDKGDTPVPETGEITFMVKNYGRTPAILKAVYANLSVGRRGYEYGKSIPESVLGEGEATSEITISMEDGITPNQAQHIGVYTAHIGFYGKIVFDDIWGMEHTTDFYFAWDKEISRMTLRYAKTEKTHTHENG